MKKDEPNPSATIQIDVRDIQLQDPSSPDLSAQSRATPPPLPPSAYAPPPAAPAPQRPNKALIYGAAFVALLAAAIFGGVKVGFALRGAPAPRASAPSAESAESAPAIVSIPTVEVNDTPDAH